MGKPVRTLKALAKNELAVRKECRRLAKALVRACAGLPAQTAGTTLERLVQIAADLDRLGKPIQVAKPGRVPPCQGG